MSTTAKKKLDKKLKKRKFSPKHVSPRHRSNRKRDKSNEEDDALRVEDEDGVGQCNLKVEVQDEPNFLSEDSDIQIAGKKKTKSKSGVKKEKLSLFDKTPEIGSAASSRESEHHVEEQKVQERVKRDFFPASSITKDLMQGVL